MRRSDANLIRRAVRERWGVPARHKAAILLDIASMISDDATPPELIAACNAILEIERENQRKEHAALRAGVPLESLAKTNYPTHTPLKELERASHSAQT